MKAHCVQCIYLLFVEISVQFTFNLHRVMMLSSSEKKLYSTDDLEWETPKSIVISGPSGSDKSTVAFSLIRERDKFFRSETRQKVYYHTPKDHSISFPPDLLADPLFHVCEGYPAFNEIMEPCICVIDDFGMDLDTIVADAFTKYSHHRNINILLLVHSIFLRDKKQIFRLISLNANLIFLLSSKRDYAQLKAFGKQIAPLNSTGFLEAYQDAMRMKKHGYLCVDVSPQSKDELKLRTHIFFDDPEPRNIVYIV